ncbi:penicillin-binding protein [Deinococcus radiodurans]|uniref:penicillin-binding protein n=1 Tax=Deinococcus radiodurans TaxID=1299 RepID=UPI00140F5819|nr:penicillin-binding protein [Deinococcus radiodurans]QIP29437.1 penicillin-binding protein [Deinococcus radiodurans]QIP31872.1 penicillin-binding protein [Deinococcus radiodurans]UTA50873.1 penicillin-binding protein [Deinococcus radiodurans]
MRLGELLPAHPWQSAEREVVVVYTHDCGDLGELWGAVLRSGLPVRAVNAEDVTSPAPAGLKPWRGPEATQFARQLKVGTYPAVLLVRGGRILNAWEGTFQGTGLTKGE